MCNSCAILKETLSQDLFIKAFLGCALLSISSGPLGIFLMLRRMTLVGDMLSHGLLPGVGLGLIIFGPSLLAMSIVGGVFSIILAGATTWAAHHLRLNEDAAFAGIYLVSLAVGALLLGQNQDNLMHILFGSMTTLTNGMILSMACVTFLTLLFFAFSYSSLVAQCFDPIFFRCKGGNERRLKMIFIVILTINIAVSFQLLGTMMAIGLMVIPALIMKLLSQNLKIMCIGASIIGMTASFIGLTLSYFYPLAYSPLIIVILGLGYIAALLYTKSRRFLS